MTRTVRMNSKDNHTVYVALHRQVRRSLPIPELCQNCEKVPPFELACVTLIYDTDPANWQWLCRSCHTKLDYTNGDRVHRTTIPPDRKCSTCNSKTTTMRKTGAARWYVLGKDGNRFQCHICYMKVHRSQGHLK